MKSKGMLMAMLGMAAAMEASMGGMPEDRMRNVGVAGNFSGSGTPANLKKKRKKPVTMWKPKTKKRKH